MASLGLRGNCRLTRPALILALAWGIGVSPVFSAPQEPAEQTQPGLQPEEEPSTRAERRRRMRLEKLEQVRPQERPPLQRAFVWFETRGRQRLENFNYKRFFPKFGGLSTGSGFAFGTRYWNPRLKGGGWDLQSSAAASFEGYKLADLQLGQIDQPERSLTAFADLYYRDFPQEDFFGLGPASLESDRTDYRIEDAFVGATVRYRKDWFQADFRSGYYQVNIRPGTDTDFPNTQELFDDVTAPGLDLQPNFFQIGGTVLLDSRDQPGNPHKGGAIRVTVQRFDDLDGNDFNFTRVAADISYFVPLWSSGRTFAIRFASSLDVEDRDNRVPFYLERTLGGSEMLRGYREFRFRDQNLAFLSAEYRWEAIPALELAVFYDAGKVFPRRTDFNLDELQTSYGFGIRIKTRSAVVFRIDLAHSREGNRAYFKFGPSF